MKRFWKNVGTLVTLFINKAVVAFGKMRNSLIITPPYVRLLSASLTERFYAKLLRMLISNMEVVACYCSPLLWVQWRLAPFKRPLGGLTKHKLYTRNRYA